MVSRIGFEPMTPSLKGKYPPNKMSNFNELILSNFKKAQSEQLKNHPIERTNWAIKNYNSNFYKFMDLDNLINFRSYKIRLYQGDMAFSNKRTVFTFLVDTFIEL